MTSTTASNSFLPFSGSAEAPEILCIADIVRPAEEAPDEAVRHRSRRKRLSHPRRHHAPRRRPEAAATSGRCEPELDAGLPVGTRVCFERRPATATAMDIDRAEFAQAAASYVFAAALLACTFFI